MKHRLARVNELIRRELGEIVNRELRFDSKLVTIQQVDITPDLRHAHIYVSFIGTETEQHSDMASLHAKRSSLQQSLSKRVVLKFTPHLHFKVDEAMERGSRVLNIMGEMEPLPPESYEDYQKKEPYTP
ncbi:MAG: rbfA [Chthoniobacteraceae bacterium]|nr:rbfA [Chthoniobacteraceae bacterium]